MGSQPHRHPVSRGVECRVSVDAVMTPTNGETYDPTWRKIASTPTAQLSSQERSAQADAVFAQVATLTEQVADINGRLKASASLANQNDDYVTMLSVRVDNLEESLRAVAAECIRRETPNRTLWQRLRWLLTGR